MKVGDVDLNYVKMLLVNVPGWQNFLIGRDVTHNQLIPNCFGEKNRYLLET